MNRFSIPRPLCCLALLGALAACSAASDDLPSIDGLDTGAGGVGVAGALPVGTAGTLPTGSGGFGVPGAGGQGLPPAGTGGVYTPGAGGTPVLGTGGAAPGAGGDPFVGAGGAAIGAGGASGGSCCANGNCICRGPDPADGSLDRNGPYAVDSYSNGFRDGPRFGGGTIYYPTDAEPPLAGLVMCPGYTARQSSIAAWGPFFASHGIILMTIDTNTTGDQVNVRDDALLDALESLKAENTRSGSPLAGRLSTDRWGLSGWSMGGGGTWLATAAHPELKSAMTLAGHNVTAGGASVARGSQVPTIMFAGATDTAILGGGQSQPVYDIIPATTPKILYEMAAQGHFTWGTPTTQGNALGRYAMAFQKLFLEGDERYKRFLLVEGPGASDWRSNIQ